MVPANGISVLVRAFLTSVAALLLFPVITHSETAPLFSFDDVPAWTAGHAPKATISTESVDGQTGRAIRIRYDLLNDHWVEIGRTASFKWREAESFRFYLRGDAIGSVFELKLKDRDGSYYGMKLPITGVSPDGWTAVTVPFRDCHYLWGGDSKLDEVESVWFAVSRGLKRAGFLDIDEFSIAPRTPGAPVVQIHASQVGYHPWDDKSFVVRVLDAPRDAVLSGAFRVVALGAEAPVYEGELKLSKFDRWEGRFLTSKFSAVRAAGTYQIQVRVWKEGGNVEWATASYPFDIAPRVLAVRTAPAQYAYARWMRCGIVCHKDDPVPGGYHDTQMDISKRMWSLPHYVLGLARYAALGAYRPDADTDGVDDALDELRFGLRFLADVPEPDGTVSWGGIEADFKKFMSYDDFISRLGPLRREDDTIPRVKYLEKNLHATCFNVAALLDGADAGRRIDPELADRAARVAQTAWKWIDAQPLETAHDYGIYLYAAASLHRRFPEGEYLHRLDEVLPKLLALQSLDPSKIANGAVGNFFFSAAERDFHFQYKFVSFNVGIHLALAMLEEDLPRDHPHWFSIHYANSVFARRYLHAMSAGSPYWQIAHGLEPGEDGRFYPKFFSGKAGERAAASFHGLNCDHFGYGYVAIKLAQLWGAYALEWFADEQMQWALGKNPLGYCMMAGVGSRSGAHMSAFYGKGPVTGEIPNGIVSGNETTEEPEWWGEGPSSGEDWLPHNSYYLSLMPELDRDAELRATITQSGRPVEGNIKIWREDGLEIVDLALAGGKAGPVALAAQARHVIQIPGSDTMDLVPVSGQKIDLEIDLDRRISFEVVVPPSAPTQREARLSVVTDNRSHASVVVRPVLSVLGAEVVSGLPESFEVAARAKDERPVVVRVSGRPVLVRVHDRDRPKLADDGFWVPVVESDRQQLLPPDEWKTEHDQGASVKIGADHGALRVEYDLSSGNWAQVKKDVNLDLRNFGAFKFRLKGTGPANKLEIKLEDADGVNAGRAIEGATATEDWRDFAIPIKEFKYWWGGDGTFDPAKLRKIFFAVSKMAGGKGTVWIDSPLFGRAPDSSLEAPSPQARFEYVKGDESVARKAAAWIASMQQPSGLILSYENDHRPFGWTYDQGICLIVLARENRPAAERLLAALEKLQKPEGHWNDGYMLDAGKPVDLSDDDRKKWFRSDVPGVLYEFDNRWIGSAAWIVYGIHRYTAVTGDTRYAAMLQLMSALLIERSSQEHAQQNLFTLAYNSTTE